MIFETPQNFYRQKIKESLINPYKNSDHKAIENHKCICLEYISKSSRNQRNSNKEKVKLQIKKMSDIYKGDI